MAWRNRDDGYGIVARGLHWATVALVVAMFAIAWYMEDLPISPRKIEIYNLHKSIGVTILAVTLVRLIWRQLSPPPPPVGLASWERLAARGSHGALYALLILQPMVGMLHTWAAGFPLVVFRTVHIGAPIAPDEALKEVLETVHGAGALGLLILVSIHVAAALRHHFILRNHVLVRMLVGRGRRGS